MRQGRGGGGGGHEKKEEGKEGRQRREVKKGWDGKGGGKGGEREEEERENGRKSTERRWMREGEEKKGGDGEGARKGGKKEISGDELGERKGWRELRGPARPRSSSSRKRRYQEMSWESERDGGSGCGSATRPTRTSRVRLLMYGPKKHASLMGG